MVKLSRESWRFYLAETDDDHEWIPNPKQSTVMPGGKVTDEMVKGWTEFLDEAEAIYAGKVLVPFWRDPGGSRGVNLRRAFTEPHGLDLVLWAQGTAALPYLEEGSITKPEFWQRMHASSAASSSGLLSGSTELKETAGGPRRKSLGSTHRAGGLREDLTGRAISVAPRQTSRRRLSRVGMSEPTCLRSFLTRGLLRPQPVDRRDNIHA